MSVTAGDREAAREIVSLWDLTKPAGPLRLAGEIAAALADEREKARANVLAAVAEDVIGVYGDIADVDDAERITWGQLRRVAEES